MKRDKAYLRIRARKDDIVVSEFLLVLTENDFSTHRSFDLHTDIEVQLERIERDKVHDYEQEFLKDEKE